MQIPRRQSEELKNVSPPRRGLAGARDDGPVHLTPEGIERLKEKLARLKKSLPELIAEAQRTADYGDRSENAEYKDAKATLRRTHRQIFTIEDQLKRMVPIQSGRNPSGTVQLGSTVTVVLESNGVQTTFQILGSFETKPEGGRISHRSPLGAALMHHKKGDVIAIKTPKGLVEYRILEIR